MAKLYEYDYLSPDDVTAQQEQLFAARAAKGDPTVHASRFIANLFGTPESIKARKVEKALTEANETFQEDPNKSVWENEAARAEHIRNAMAGIDPALALQANERYLAARTEAENQRRLKAQDDRAARKDKAQEARDANARRLEELKLTPAIYRRDRRTGRTELVRAFKPDTPLDVVARSIQEENGQNSDPNVEYIDGNAADALMQDPWHRPGGGGFDGEDGFDMNNSTRSGHLETIAAAEGTFSGVTDLVNAVVENTEAAVKIVTNPSDANDIVDYTTRIVNAVSVAQNIFGQQFKDSEQRDAYSKDAEKTIDETIDAYSNSTYKDAYNDLSIDRSVVNSQIKALAYQLAKTLDPGGRLSNQDVDMSMEMIVGDGRPEVIERLLNSRLRNIEISVNLASDYARRGALHGQVGRDAYDRMEARKEEVKAALARLAETNRKRREAAAKGGSKPAQQPAATGGRSSTPAQDGQATSRLRIIIVRKAGG